MVEKTITLQDLKTLAKEGATIEVNRQPVSIEGFTELVEALRAMMAAEEERIRADIARNQTNLEILATLQAVVRKQGSHPKPEPVDLSPLVGILEEIRSERDYRARVAYDFDITRDGRGFAQKITATPVQPVKH